MRSIIRGLAAITIGAFLTSCLRVETYDTNPPMLEVQVGRETGLPATPTPYPTLEAQFPTQFPSLAPETTYTSIQNLPVRAVGGRIVYYSNEYEPAISGFTIYPDVTRSMGTEGLAVVILSDDGHLIPYKLYGYDNTIEVWPGENDVHNTALMIPGNVMVPSRDAFNYLSKDTGCDYFPVDSRWSPMQQIEYFP